MVTIHQVWAVYFSATGTTRKVVCRLAQELSRALIAPCREDDLTPPESRLRSRKFQEGDLVVLGLPAYGGRVPKELLSCLRAIQGGGALTVPVVLYGNRSYGDALLELRQQLEADGFWPVAAGAFVGEHALASHLAQNRPDSGDMAWVDRLAEATVRKLRTASPEELLRTLEVDGRDPVRPYYQPLGRDGRRISLQNVRPQIGDSCGGCGLCARLCPMGSIRLVEGLPHMDGSCIQCGACVKSCPRRAIYFDDPDYLFHIHQLEDLYAQRKPPSLFV